MTGVLSSVSDGRKCFSAGDRNRFAWISVSETLKSIAFWPFEKNLKYIIPQTRPPHYVWFLPEPCKSYEVCAFINSILSFDDHATTVFVKI